jgi:hypothetical protein
LQCALKPLGSWRLTTQNPIELNYFIEIIGDYAGDLVAEYGAKGLKLMGLDEMSEKLLRRAGLVDDVVEDIIACRFAEDTAVMTRDGPVAIKDVRVGQEVLAFNEDTGEVGYYPVRHVWAHKDPLIVTLTVDGETIETTPEHPFYTRILSTSLVCSY